MSTGTTRDKQEQTQTRSSLRWIALATFLVLVAAILILALVLSGQSLLDDNQASGWTSSTPEEQGINSGKLEAMMAYVKEHDMAVDSIVIVRHGQIVFEEYGNGYTQGKIHRLYSVTKSVTSMLVGIALDAGYIEGLDVPLAELLPDYTSANPDSRRERITLEHLLSMSDGMDWHEHDYPYGDPRNPTHQMSSSSDALQFVLDQPMAREPGEAWAYNSGASMLLGGILEETTGRDLLAFARQVLFDPIGIGLVRWTKAPGGHYYTDGGLYMTPRDMARLGYLMLHNGTWEGRQIVPPDWVTRSTTAQYPAYGAYGYGYQWWIWPDGQGYMAQGLYEQKIIVLPKADMVVVATARISSESFYGVDGLVNAFIVPACTDLPLEAQRKTYAAYGFTFEYPGGFYLEEQPIPGRDTLSDISGIVQIRSNTEPIEIVSVLWDEAEAGLDAQTLLEAYLAGLAETGAVAAPGESVESEKDGHPMVLRISDLALGGGTLPSVSGAWICDRANRAFAVTYLTTAEMTSTELQATFERYLEGLSCH
jgi:CubicO group peptidase (beta-lactamase class C family)